jgi:hypothetical protein
MTDGRQRQRRAFGIHWAPSGSTRRIEHTAAYIRSQGRLRLLSVPMLRGPVHFARPHKLLECVSAADLNRLTVPAHARSVALVTDGRTARLR